MLEVMISFAVLQGVVTVIFISVTTSSSVGGCCRAVIGSLCCNRKLSKRSGTTIQPTGYSDLEGGGHAHNYNTTNGGGTSTSSTGESSPFLATGGGAPQPQPKGKVLLEKVVLAKGNEE
eukprot:TRINITY_DN16959_c0_g2_i2.p1 TRINITY_DN16959_c0_g2~~TRINITY_DN16959_c0_g2_i2.p1  ORF type:complete len:119 (-),score=18.94 TRINITY_DN16959_c0_g2_i2:13-369(-)